MKVKSFVYVAMMFLSIFGFSTYTAANQPSPIPDKSSVVKVSQPINLNKADLATLVHSFKGIGAKRAQAIIAYRDAHGGFKSIEELARVKGFGEKFVQKHFQALKQTFTVG